MVKSGLLVGSEEEEEEEDDGGAAAGLFVVGHVYICRPSVPLP